MHPSVNIGGGAERVCVSIIESLKENGHSVTLGTFDKPDWGKVEKYFGKVVRPDVEIVKPRVFGLSAYGELLNFHLLSSNVSRNYDAAVVSCISPWFYCPPSKKTIIYLIPPVDYQRGFKRMYLKPYVFVQNRFLKKVKNKIALTNSSFSSKVIEDVYSLKSQILYPPVDLGNFRPSAKEDLVVSVGRFNPFKRFEVLVRSFLDVDSGKCVIVGSTYGGASGSSSKYVEGLRRMICKLGLQDRVELLVNSPFGVLQSVLSKAKVYVHCALFEHFGISVVEGMASGCVPIVHRSGGTYSDIIEYDRYGFSFEDSSELADRISSLLKDDGLCKRFSEEAIKRSRVFSRENFKKGMVDIVESDF
jgi:glycosyltransferase involved in cell wall biosynthesis